MITIIHLVSLATQAAQVIQLGVGNLAAVTQAVVQSVA